MSATHFYFHDNLDEIGECPVGAQRLPQTYYFPTWYAARDELCKRKSERIRMTGIWLEKERAHLLRIFNMDAPCPLTAK